MGEQQNNPQENSFEGNANSGNPSTSFYQRHKIAIWIIGILVGVCVIYAIFSGLGTKRYVGSNTTCEVVVELKSDDTFTFELTMFQSGKTTELNGNYKLLGTNEDVLQLNFDDGGVWVCDINVNIHGTPFISFTNVASGLPPCYLE